MAVKQRQQRDDVKCIFTIFLGRVYTIMSTFDSATWSSHPHSPPSFDALQSWLQAQGAYVDTRINGRHDGEFGWHIQASHDIEAGTMCEWLVSPWKADCETLTTVGMIPKALVLSHQTCSLTRHIALPSDGTAAEVTLHLAACLLHELRLGVESTFWPALQMLPREAIPVPTFWARYGQDGQEALRWLQGTTAEKELKRKDLEGLSLVRVPFPITPCCRSIHDLPGTLPRSPSVAKRRATLRRTLPITRRNFPLPRQRAEPLLSLITSTLYP